MWQNRGFSFGWVRRPSEITSNLSWGCTPAEATTSRTMFQSPECSKLHDFQLVAFCEQTGGGDFAVLAVPPSAPQFTPAGCISVGSESAESWTRPSTCVFSGRLGWRVDGPQRGTVAQFLEIRHVGFGPAPPQTPPAGGKVVLPNTFTTARSALAFVRPPSRLRSRAT